MGTERIATVSTLRAGGGPAALHFPALGPLGRTDDVIGRQRTLARGEHLFRSGEPCDEIYLLLKGSLKVYRLTTAGDEQVTGFEFAGDMLGLEALGTPIHQSSAMALEPARVCAVTRRALERGCHRSPGLQHLILRLASRRITELQERMLRLGKMSAAERLVNFLLELSARIGSRDMVLSMPRYAIGCYLGLALETVSRVLGQLAEEGLISVRGRRIRLLQPERLRRLDGGTPT